MTQAANFCQLQPILFVPNFSGKNAAPSEFPELVPVVVGFSVPGAHLPSASESAPAARPDCPSKRAFLGPTADTVDTPRWPSGHCARYGFRRARLSRPTPGRDLDR